MKDISDALSISITPISIDVDQLDSLSVPELVALVKQLLRRVEALETENAGLKEQLRASKRATAPFSKGKSKAAPKPPGRKAGQGRFARRMEPQPGPMDQVEDLEVPLDTPDCPQCGAPLDVQKETVTVEDTLPQPVRQIRRFHVEQGRCPVCGWNGRGRHPDLPAGQHGATAHRTGPQVMAQALTLHYHFGLPLSKVPAVMESTTGIRLSQSALTQAAGALCAPDGAIQTAYQELRRAIPSAPVVNARSPRRPSPRRSHRWQTHAAGRCPLINYLSAMTHRNSNPHRVFQSLPRPEAANA